MRGKCQRVSERVWCVGRGGWGGAQEPLSKPVDCNVFLIDGGDELALVDMGIGPDAPQILANIEATGCDGALLTTVFITHAHGDHSGGLRWLRGMTEARIVAGAVTARALETADPCVIGDLGPFRAPGTKPVTVDKWLDDGEEYTLGDVTVTALHTPGHTVDSTCFITDIGRKRLLFSGDTAIGNQPRRDFGRRTIVKGMLGWLDGHWSAPVSQYVESIKRLEALNADLLLPGHGMVNNKAVAAEGLREGRKRLQRLLDDRELFIMFALER